MKFMNKAKKKLDKIKWNMPTRGGDKEESGYLFFIFTSGEPPL